MRAVPAGAGPHRFIPVLAVAAAADVALLAQIGADLTEIAVALCILEGACASVLLTLCLRRRRSRGHPGAAFLPV